MHQGTVDPASTTQMMELDHGPEGDQIMSDFTPSGPSSLSPVDVVSRCGHQMGLLDIVEVTTRL